MNFEDLTLILEETYKETVALVPGSFKPPHKGHLDMVKQYSKKADKVIVMISNPSKARPTKTGGTITPKIAKKIFDLYIKKAGLKNVEIVESPDPSPVTAVYKYIEDKLSEVNVLLGASDKGGDWKRWSGAQKAFQKTGQKVNIVDPQKAAVRALGDISASYIRDNIDQPEKIREFFPDEISDTEFEKILKLIG